MNKNRKLINAFLVSTMMLSGLALDVSAADNMTVDRLGGNTRVETALKVSDVAYDTADTIVVAGYNGEVDALTGTLLASSMDAPLLLVSNKDADIAAVKAEAKRLGAENVYLLGSTKVVSTKIETAMKDAGLNVERIAGNDRFDTAAAVAEKVGSETGHAFLTYDGRNGILADALAAGPASGMKNSPILLTGSTNLPTQTITALTDLNISEVTIVGGRNIVNDDIIAELEAMDITVDRVAGNNRWETAEEVAEEYFADAADVIIANDGYSGSFADALVGGYFGAQNEMPVLLTQVGKLPEATVNFLGGKAMHAYVLGSKNVVSDAVLTSIEEIIAENKIVDGITEATEAVEKAEESLLDEDFVAAEKLVKALDKSDAKTLLSARLTELQAERAAVVAKVTKALDTGNNIQLYAELSEVPFTDVNSDYIADYRAELNKADTDKATLTGIQKAIDAVNKAKLDAELASTVSAAQDALEAVREYTTATANADADKEFTKLVEKAQKAIDELPADYKVNEDDETPLQEDLQTKLNEKVKLNNDYVNYVRSINKRANAKDQIKLNSELKAAGIQNVDSSKIVNYIAVLNTGEFTTLEEIQEAIDLFNANTAVAELSGDKLTQKNIDAAKAMVNLLPGVVEEDEEDYNSDKAALMIEVKAAQDLFTATEAVNALTTEKDDETILVGDQKAINAANKLVEALDETDAKTALQAKVFGAQSLLNENLVKEVTKEVNALFKQDKDGKVIEPRKVAKGLSNKDILDAKKSVEDLDTLDADGKLAGYVNDVLRETADTKVKALTDDDKMLVADKAAIDEAQELVTALPEDVDSVTTKAVLQPLVDVAYINLAINTEDSIALQNIIVGLDATGFTDLNRAQRNEIGAFMIREAKNNENYEEVADKAAFKTSVEEAITTYTNKIAAFNAAANKDVVTGADKAALVTAIKDVMDLDGLSGTQELNLAEAIFSAKPEADYNAKTIAAIEIIVEAAL